MLSTTATRSSSSATTARPTAARSPSCCALPWRPGDAETLLEAFGPAFERAVSERDPDTELDYPLLIRGLLGAVNVFPDTGACLPRWRLITGPGTTPGCCTPRRSTSSTALRTAGLKIAIVSNTFDPPALMHEDLAEFGIGERVDAEVFSSELGFRKPHPEIYRHALAQIGVEPTAALFAGDRVLEDVIGPSALGLRTCLCLYYRQDEGDHSLADFRARTPLGTSECCS